jgi:hypothetical protein
MRPGWTKRIHLPISTAIGMVETTVNMPQGLLVSALTTISDSTARIDDHDDDEAAEECDQAGDLAHFGLYHLMVEIRMA